MKLLKWKFKRHTNKKKWVVHCLTSEKLFKKLGKSVEKRSETNQGYLGKKKTQQLFRWNEP